jgi:hypothetical protein
LFLIGVAVDRRDADSPAAIRITALDPRRVAITAEAARSPGATEDRCCARSPARAPFDRLRSIRGSCCASMVVTALIGSRPRAEPAGRPVEGRRRRSFDAASPPILAIILDRLTYAAGESPDLRERSGQRRGGRR